MRLYAFSSESRQPLFDVVVEVGPRLREDGSGGGDAVFDAEELAGRCAVFVGVDGGRGGAGGGGGGGSRERSGGVGGIRVVGTAIVTGEIKEKLRVCMGAK